MNIKIQQLEQETFEENDSPEIPPPDIVAYNELRSCADLYRMKTDGVLEIHPEFQREFIWKQPDQTRFIDSLIKQLPIPSMCFSLDHKLQKWQVIDGLQRMSTICKFLSGDTWKLSSLDDVDPHISGKQAKLFHDRNSNLYPLLVRLQNVTLPITVIRCDYSKKSHTRYLFTIFHRLNTGGMKLNNQEIRNCIYSGKLNDLIKELNQYPDWMKLNRMKRSTGHRFTKQELILRLFAFHDNYKNYSGRLARFLNDYMDDHRNPPSIELETKRDLFKRTLSIVYKRLYKGTPPPKQPLSVLEATLVGVSFNHSFLETIPDNRLRTFQEALLKDEEFSEKKLLEGLSGKTRVIDRIEAARKIFSGR
jgi:hypothetical protein